MGFFGRKQEMVPPHPRENPYENLPLTVSSVEGVFGDCVDFAKRSVEVCGDKEKTLTLIYVVGMVRMERVSDYLLRPLAQDESLANCATMGELMLKVKAGALYNLGVEERYDVASVIADLIDGNCILFFGKENKVLSFQVGTEEKRTIMPPTNETVLKGSRDSFVESIRTNTSLVRRHIKTPNLRITEEIVGRQSVTTVDILSIEGITNPDTVEEIRQRIRHMDIDAVIATGNIEEYLVDKTNTPFPLMQYTERPDRFTAGLVEGRAGILIDGLPLGYLVPASLSNFLRASQDKSNNWMLATVLTILRYFCMFITLFLPALYVAMVTFHQEMIPTRLALSILSAKQDVPFSTVVEVLILLFAFEILQEAGLRLPQSIGQTVSIIGGLVVGTAAVTAKIVSPAVLIAVAIAGIAGYTMPSQELAGALRIWRFVLAVLGSLAGMFGVVIGSAILVGHLAGIESFGVSYLTPFAANEGDQVEGDTVVRLPLNKVKMRPKSLHTKNRRNQR